MHSVIHRIETLKMSLELPRIKAELSDTDGHNCTEHYYPALQTKQISLYIVHNNIFVKQIKLGVPQHFPCFVTEHIIIPTNINGSICCHGINEGRSLERFNDHFLIN